MKSALYLFFTLFILFACNLPKEQAENEIPFDTDWKFALNDQPGAENVKFDDDEWHSIEVPHDFSIEQPFDSLNSTGGSGGFAYSGIGWYRKHFVLPEETIDKYVSIRFDGVYRNSEVWINGKYLGLRPYGYSTFTYNLTPYLNKPGKDNVLSVKVNTSDQPNSRWYTGAGIYRHVWLHVSDKTHFVPGGVFIKTDYAMVEHAWIDISAEVDIDSAESRVVELKSELTTASGEVISSRLDTVNSASINGKMDVRDPRLWSIDNPYLYHFTCQILANGEVLDSYETDFGIRMVEWDPNKGFLLNGEHIKLKGTNNHHDGGPLGAACLDYTFERQIRILKSMGSNALRISHNPPAPELLKWADKLGMVVIDEIFDEWLNGKKPYGYAPEFDNWYEKDVADWIRRDRNHACVVAWSLGNEVPEQRMDSVGVNTLKQLIETAKKHDTTRPFTSACNEMPSANASGFSEALDIVGYNYREPMYKSDHEKYPNRVIFGSETVIYPYQPGDGFPLHSYNEWVEGQLEDYVAGEFLWTGFDYLGETGIGAGGTSYEPWNTWPTWPWRSAVCGVVDLCGFDRPAYWYRKALWSDEPVLYMAVPTKPSANDIQACPFWGWPDVWPHWNYDTEGEILKVQVYTNCKEVELFLNGKSLGVKSWDIHNEAFLTWDVPYEKGTLEAVGLASNGEKKTFKLQTAGEPVRIVITPERETISSDIRDVNYLKVELYDANDILVPFASNLIHFKIKGAGKLLSVGNGNPASHTSFKGNKIEAFHGRCLAIVQSDDKSGILTLIAKSEGLEPTAVQIKVE